MRTAQGRFIVIAVRDSNVSPVSASLSSPCSHRGITMTVRSQKERSRALSKSPPAAAYKSREAATTIIDPSRPSRSSDEGAHVVRARTDDLDGRVLAARKQLGVRATELQEP